MAAARGCVRLLLGCLTLGCDGAIADAVAGGGARDVVANERGPGLARLLLTGEIDAARGQTLAVPRQPQWNVTLRWIEKDGTQVKAGQKVAELDDSAFSAELTQKKIAAEQARNDVLHQKNESAIVRLEKSFAVEEARIELEKARLEASVDRDSYPLRVYQEKQVELQRREAALARALDEQRAYEQSGALELRVLEIALDKREREVQAAEAAIRALSLTAPSDGIVLTNVHPWFQRKVQSGDNVWVNFALMRLPDLTTLEIVARLSDVDDGRIRPGERVVAHLDAYPELSFPGRVVEVGPIAREMSPNSLRRSFAVRIALDQIDAERMLPGMSVRVEVLGPSAQNGAAPGGGS
jgi:multidrug resistance efflux pump